jgi:hypothetical protein
MPRHSKSKPLTDEERAELLAQVYALILSPQRAFFISVTKKIQPRTARGAGLLPA